MLTAKPTRASPWALIPLVAGLFWLSGTSFHWLLCGLVPGILLLAGGASLLLWPGESRIVQAIAGGGVLGVLFAIPAAFVGGIGSGLLAAAWSLLSFVAAGRISLLKIPSIPTVPAPEHTLAMYLKAALDEALLSYFILLSKMPDGDEAEVMCDTVCAVEAALASTGVRDDPLLLHRLPPAPEDATLTPGRALGHSFDWLSFSSGFVPDARILGPAEWDDTRTNNQCHAIVLRHQGESRPWLLCIHGFRMGVPALDLQVFPPRWLHERLGLNVVMPHLPLHGRRRVGRFSGDRYMDGNILYLLHTQSQALWDLRRTIAWIRAQDPGARIGVFGLSLGGYNAALLAGYEPDLEFVVAGIPLTDFSSTLWKHLPQPLKEYFHSRGFDVVTFERILQPISPLSRPPLLDRTRLGIFAGAGDRVVEPELPQRLGAHWGVPVDWYQGAHLTFRGEEAVRRTINTAMVRAGWRKGS
jgi:pimeloyl-ACP methyl ester carboxylesterase